jgi:hypothetical protein
MKRVALVKHLEAHGCCLLRDRGKHSVYVNPTNNSGTPDLHLRPETRALNSQFARSRKLATSSLADNHWFLADGEGS